MNATTAVPVRRSALEGVHARLGAGWPLNYGDEAGEQRAAEQAIGLAEPGLSDKWVLRGAGALDAVRAVGLQGAPGRVTVGSINVWAVAPDEVWLVTSAPTSGGPVAPSTEVSSVLDAARKASASVTDVSSGWAALYVTGPQVRELLEEFVAIDLSDGAVADRAIAQVAIAGCRVVMCRLDGDGIPGFTLLVARDEAEYLWETLLHIGEPYGVRPIGTSALERASASRAGSGAAS